MVSVPRQNSNSCGRTCAAFVGSTIRVLANMRHTAVSRVLNFMRNLKLAHILVAIVLIHRNDVIKRVNI